MILRLVRSGKARQVLLVLLDVGEDERLGAVAELVVVTLVAEVGGKLGVRPHHVFPLLAEQIVQRLACCMVKDLEDGEARIRTLYSDFAELAVEHISDSRILPRGKLH